MGCWRNKPLCSLRWVRLKKHSFWIRHNKRVNQINGPAIWNAEAILLSWRILDELERSGETLAIAWTQGIASVEFKWCRQIISTPLPQNAGTNSPLLFWNRCGIAHRLFSNLSGKQNAAELDIYPIVWRQFSWKFAIEKRLDNWHYVAKFAMCRRAVDSIFHRLLPGSLTSSGMQPRWYLVDTSLPPRIPRYQRGTKEVPKRRYSGGSGILAYFRGGMTVRHPFPRSPSQVYQNTVTFLNKRGRGGYIFALSSLTVSFSLRTTGKSEPGNPLPW